MRVSLKLSIGFASTQSDEVRWEESNGRRRGSLEAGKIGRAGRTSCFVYDRPAQPMEMIFRGATKAFNRTCLQPTEQGIPGICFEMLTLYHECRRTVAKDLLSASSTALPAWRRFRSASSSAVNRKRQWTPQHSYQGQGYQRQNVPYGGEEGLRQNPSYGQEGPGNNFQKSTRLRPPIRRPFHRQETPIAPPPVISPERAISYFHESVGEWRYRPHTLARLASYGLPVSEANKLLNLYIEQVQQGALDSDADYHLERFSQRHDATSIDTVFSTIFFDWASRKQNQQFFKEKGVDSGALSLVNELVERTSRQFPADEFAPARTLHRKVIMHVGPTNSGKTHHALRALAAARSGLYAGPLRLLAHEIWQRLNSGQIVPLGEDAQVPTNPKGDPKYARLCNLMTGEEQKLVDGDVAHMSCTVEMVTFTAKYDVAVIDEIQMLGDDQRGSGWTNAVLGVWAKEVHLCGEETAVPIVQALLEGTGDELEIRRYERLTPLTVEAESLKGDLTKIQKGDCVVAFNRSSIFALRKSIEELTGMRCAVVYGRLPPEVRSEQAALFNDPDSGYDVIVGSDCIGMGLNLKIKRVVFSATSKYDGRSMMPLEVSAVKQIAGRAGRYGLHKEQTDLGGTTTTLFEDDLPHLKHCIEVKYTPLSHARIGYNSEFLTNVLTVLPPSTSMHAAISAPRYIGRLPPYIRYADDSHLEAACTFIDTHWKNMMIGDKIMLLNSPIPWRDINTVEILRTILSKQGKGDIVDFAESLRGTGLIEMVDELENKIRMEEAGLESRARGVAASLLQMESLHKVLGLYLWMTYRSPLLYSDGETARSLKGRLERVLNWCLDRLSGKLQKEQGLRAMVQNVVPAIRVDRRDADALKKVSLLDAATTDAPPTL